MATENIKAEAYKRDIDDVLAENERLRAALEGFIKQAEPFMNEWRKMLERAELPQNKPQDYHRLESAYAAACEAIKPQDVPNPNIEEPTCPES